MEKIKPFNISKQLVVKAYEKVKSNKGAAGVDQQSLTEFDKNLKDNLYKLWNRMTSGSYFPPPVKAVEIPKRSGGIRTLGVPTVTDRIAQTVVAMMIEDDLEKLFHEADIIKISTGRNQRGSYTTMSCLLKLRRFIKKIVKFMEAQEFTLNLKNLVHHAHVEE